MVALVVLRCVWWFAQARQLPACVEAADHELVVRVLAAKSTARGVAQLDVRVARVLSSVCAEMDGQRLRLSWYYPEFVAVPGMLLHADVRLRKPWGSRNPGGFDYGMWLLGQGYRASGYLRQVQQANPRHGRGSLHPRLQLDNAGYVYAGLLNAIALGVRDGVSAELWALFRATGTIHLMVVSGLHVGVFAGGVYVLAFSLLRLITRLPPRWSPRRIALLFSLLAIALLLYQTGLQAPVLRAALMAGAFILTMLLSRQAPWWRSFFIITAAAILLEPRMLLQQGFWLSYAAVAGLLFFFAPRKPAFTWVRGFVACQWVLLLNLTPWLGVTVGEVPLVGPLANLLVVPLMSLVTIPLAMAGALMSTVALLQPLGHICLVVADHSLGLVVYVLEILRGAFGSIGYFSWQQAAQGMLAAAVLLLPVSSGVRGLALLCWLTLLLPPSPRLSPAEFRITVLDVGQGSAALVDTARHRLVVDAGPAYASGFNSGQSVVLPALRSTGADRLHGLLVSHGDNDHAGGADSVLSRYPRARAIGVSNACRHGRRWRWDGVDFKLLLDTRAGNSNDGSCTLLVTNGRRSAYLSGDIGVRVERRLLPELPRGVDLLVAPHHGSTTSSSTPFVEHLCPKFVVFSAGRHNRYGHPRKSVVARYVRVGARYVVTGLSGAAVWRSDQADVLKTWRGGRVNAAAGSCLPPQSSVGSR